MAGGPDRGSQNPSSLWQAVGQAFGPLREQPALVLTLAFGILAVGGAGVLLTDGAGRVVVFGVLGVLVLLFAIGLVAGRDRKAPGVAEAPPAQAAQAVQGTRMRLVIGDGSEFEAENLMNARDSDSYDAELKVGDRDKVKLRDAMNEGTDKAE